jgi:hypothetical protein
MSGVPFSDDVIGLAGGDPWRRREILTFEL